MVDFPIRRGSANGDVARLQGLLNKRGALLEEDGLFGGASERAVKDAQAAFGLPVTGQCDQTTWTYLQSVPEPSPLLPARGLAFIGCEEVSSRERYDSKFCRACWPSEDSGITIGIGYDLQHARPAQFDSDWQSVGLAAETMAAFRPWLGKVGSRAGVDALYGHSISFDKAWRVFVERSVPLYVERTTHPNAFASGYDALPGLCKSALVSLVYNRGSGMQGNSRSEMRTIRDLIAAGSLDAVPAQFEAMVRLWPEGSGLRVRRVREAQLWRDGLANG